MAIQKSTLSFVTLLQFFLISSASLEQPVQEFPTRQDKPTESRDETPRPLDLPQLSKFTASFLDPRGSMSQIGSGSRHVSKRLGVGSNQDNQMGQRFLLFGATQRIMREFARSIINARKEQDHRSVALENAEPVQAGALKEIHTSTDNPESDTTIDNKGMPLSPPRSSRVWLFQHLLNLIAEKLPQGSGLVDLAQNNDGDATNEENDSKPEADNLYQLEDDDSGEIPETLSAAKRIYLMPTPIKEVDAMKKDVPVTKSKNMFRKVLFYMIRQPMFFRSPATTFGGVRRLAKRKWYFKRYMYFDDLASGLVG